MTPTEIRALHPAAIVEAWEWIDTYCPHYATQGRDWQTTDNMSAASRVMAKRRRVDRMARRFRTRRAHRGQAVGGEAAMTPTERKQPYKTEAKV